LFQLVADRAEREEDRGKTLDAKITALLAGVVTFIGFSFRLQSTPWSTGAALIYFIPLGFLTRRLDVATILTAAATLIVLVTQFVVVLR
jgi:hypothetical protein